jgi:hypothetical protein
VTHLIPIGEAKINFFWRSQLLKLAVHFLSQQTDNLTDLFLDGKRSG